LRFAGFADIADRISAGINREHIRAAIEDFRAGVVHGFGRSTFYDVLYENERYPLSEVHVLGRMEYLKTSKHSPFAGRFTGFGEAPLFFWLMTPNSRRARECNVRSLKPKSMATPKTIRILTADPGKVNGAAHAFRASVKV
jgi:hypothetical protein